MLASRNALQSYPSLRGESCPNYFSSRAERNQYFENTSADIPEYVAIADNGQDPATADWGAEIWQVEYFNGINWIAVTLSKNFALLVTNEGLKALTNASAGQYKLELSRILIKQSLIPAGEDVATWTFDKFITIHGYSDICLDTNNVNNTTFTLENNVTHKTNLLNGGIQFTLLLDTNCVGQKTSEVSDLPVTPTETEFDIATIGLCVKDQRENAPSGTSSSGDTLFAVACLPTKLQKVATTPSQIGNSIKMYLNTTLSNFGNVVNLPIEKSSVNSVPEVVTEDDLVDAFPAGSINSPYNLYVVDNYSGTNLPALAVRKGNPVAVDNPVTWTYFTPTDDTLDVDPGVVDSSLKNFMIASWDGAKYIPTNSKENNTQIGLYVDSTIIYAGKVNNPNTDFNYNIILHTENAVNYHVGDILTATENGITFNLTITDVDQASGKPLTCIYTPLNGNVVMDPTTELQPTYHSSSAYRTGSGLVITIESTPQTSGQNLQWQFPASWVNKPLFADYNHNGGEASGYTWSSYCAAAGIPTTSNKNRSGYLTPVENEFTTSHFVGWCINENTIKLALDLRNEASYAIYGTTRYATHAEVNSLTNESYDTTSVNPRNLKRNYFQITTPGTSETDADNNITNDGSTRAKAIKVDTYTTFTKSIECTGTDLNGVAFKGTAYRALWEDLAEYYRSDKVYPAGTLITIGAGINEITEAKVECNGIISQKPGYQLGEKKDKLDLPVALVGKVPVLFAQDCVPHFGDRIYLSKNNPGKASIIPFGKCLGKIIDKREHLDQYASLMCSVRIEF